MTIGSLTATRSIVWEAWVFKGLPSGDAIEVTFKALIWESMSFGPPRAHGSGDESPLSEETVCGALWREENPEVSH